MFRFFSLAFFFFGVFFSPVLVGAARLEDQILDQVQVGAAEAQLTTDPSGAPIDPRSVVAGVIQIVLSLLGIIFVSLLVAGGYKYMTAQGDDGRISEATTTIRNAVIGLILITAAYSITLFVFRGLEQAVSDGGTLPGEERVDVQENTDRINDALNDRIDEFFR